MDITSNLVNLIIDAVRIERYADILRSLDPDRLGNLEKIVGTGGKQDVSRNRINANGIGVARMEQYGGMDLGTVRQCPKRGSQRYRRQHLAQKGGALSFRVRLRVEQSRVIGRSGVAQGRQN